MAEFVTDENTDAALYKLQEVFGVNSKAQVIRKALALAMVAANHRDENGMVTIRGKDSEVKVSLRG